MSQSGGSLSQRVARAGFWAVALQAVLRLFNIAKTIVLARLLVPGDFGLMGIALVVMTLLDTFTKTGFRAALVQRQGDVRPYLDTTWTVELLRRLVLAVILILAAPFIAKFFDTPPATLIIRVLAISTLLGGLTNVGIVYFEKDLQFQKRFTFQLAETMAATGVAIGMAIALHNVWALVYGELAGTAVRLIGSYVLHPYRPRPQLDWAKAKQLYQFGRWVLAVHIIVFLALKLDSIVIGKLLGPIALGLYQIADRISDLVQEAGSAIGTVAFPAYSKVQSDSIRVRYAYHQLVEVACSVALPLSTAVVLLAPDFTRLVLGQQWLAAVPAMQVLGVAAGVKAIEATGGPLLWAAGLPRLDFQKNLLRAVLLAIFIYPFILWWGIVGAALAILIATCSTLPFHIMYTRTTLQSGIGDVVKPLLLPAILSGVLGATVALFQSQIGLQGWYHLVLVSAVATVVYLGSLCAAWHFFKSGPLNLAWNLATRASTPLVKTQRGEA